jgi:hypothetical protein
MSQHPTAVAASVLAAMAGITAILIPMLVFGSPLLFLLATVVAASILMGLGTLTAYLFYDGLPIEWYVPGVGILAACLLIGIPFVFMFTALASIRPPLLYSNAGCGVLGGMGLLYALFAGRDAGSLTTFEQETP